MTGCHKARITKLVAAAAYMLALAVSIAHNHRHAADGWGCSASHVTKHCDGAGHDHDHYGGQGNCGDPPQAIAGEMPVPSESPSSSSDECEICRFLGRPILLVRPFELTLAAERVAPVAEQRTPELQPVVAIVACARAPPALSSAA